MRSLGIVAVSCLLVAAACSDDASSTDPGSSGGASSSGASGASGSSGSSGSSGASSGSSGGSSGSGGPCAQVQCGANAKCLDATGKCMCNPGFVSDGTGACVAAPAGDPSTHTQAEVCTRWKQGHVQTSATPWTAGAAQCDPGTLAPAAITDTLTRLALYRWMEGLAPVSDAPAQSVNDMACAAVASWNPPGTVPNPHAPPPSAKCYTAAGAQGAGTSNIAWGSGHPANAIDQFMEDRGNDTTFGHRRWIMNPPLGVVGIGYYAGGGTYGNAQCLGVFDQSGRGTAPEWLSFPPPGFSPTSVVGWTWTFHAKASTANAQMTVKRMSDGANLAMTKLTLQQGYGSYSTQAFRQSGWTPKDGEVYLVSVSGVAAQPITYEVKPVACP